MTRADGSERQRQDHIVGCGVQLHSCIIMSVHMHETMLNSSVPNADVLANRKTVGQIRGKILFGGKQPTKSFLRRYTGYVEQHGKLSSCTLLPRLNHSKINILFKRADTLLENLTVKEMLMYTSELKNPMSESYRKKMAKVDVIIDQLALKGCAGVRIGSALQRGISGAHHQRW